MFVEFLKFKIGSELFEDLIIIDLDPPQMGPRYLHMPGECVASIPRRHGSHEGKWHSHLGKYFFLMFLQ